ncbi:MAG: hypothetical protein A3F31_01085 [Candidatus Levybacteria bacterium RIFCSPHIGHO2_12_FULL_38_12]|nr:MAG: hypothetical protein A2770_01845 [Candidatus Levybacteria bacterium RIFCSPHIGHO2_01_FULL_38_12]OGH22039.1 MAG: hypothetical protein A3D75_03375 [Candidatus Levybacteria bacterium RIFCSPHIGHO2_02_FULL_37_18]OGH23243.1 MAG: hypothetical protein A3F31_01085 [Candidatus Levybacteria bacterium RIFCSPHIGHO2_12_FULL_38_12]OGH33732.1 MAG: hypothetical protein A3A47_02810 [Candidatus Levybacteria bacterium RIFCSPLOWO2_01_FULL_37_20]OGH44638.1 MAG: hypothetical protein A3J14_00895 [Candidatus Lev
MKNLFIIANWKSNKTTQEAKEWFEKSLEFRVQSLENKEIIICPSFTVMSQVKQFTKHYQLPFKLGAQDISAFDEGSYTGDVNGKQIKEFAEYVIVGHSERRNNNKEDDLILEKKVLKAKEYGLNVIYCVRSMDDIIPKNVFLVAYEPVFAIGTGTPDTPENADAVSKELKQKYHIKNVLYGGSVTSTNVNSFTTLPHIDGVLVGKASLNLLEFSNIIQNA